MNETRYQFDSNYPPGRLDAVLAAQLEDVSRSRIQKLIRQGNVRVDGQVILKPAYKLDGDELLKIEIPEVQITDLIPESIPLDIVYEDRNLIVINKSAGMVVHPSAGHSSGTLVNAVLGHAPDIDGVGGELRPGIVHRLDKDTSGIILVAKNGQTLQYLQAQFSSRKVEKGYFALVEGIPKSPVGRIEAEIGRSKRDRKKMDVFPDGKARDAITFYRVIKEFDRHTYLEAKPETGRTHQIRLHLAFIGNPIVGDRVYGRKKPSLKLKRHFLHAGMLKIVIPGETDIKTFEAPLPEDLSSVLDSLGK